MTAVKGIELFPLREDTVDSSLEVKDKSEPSPFDRLLEKKDPVEDEPARLMKPEKTEAPVQARVYSAKKIAALIQTAKEEGLVKEGIRPDFAALGKKAAPQIGRDEGNLRKIQIVKTAYPAAKNRVGKEENIPELISRFLKGEITPEELDSLVRTDRESGGEKIRLFSSPKESGSPEKVAGEIGTEEGKKGDILRGFLTDEGKLVYFEEAVPGKDLKVVRSEKPDNSPKVSGSTKNRIQIEVNVADLRTAQALPSGEAAAAREKLVHQVSAVHERENSDGESPEDLLSGPAEKLFSAEGAGGKLEAPVSREVSRLFRDYMNDTGSKELVRKIDFILKNDNQGEIKLILKPEALGNVRINLSLNENHIAGKIFVDNSSVRDIFLNNLDHLTNLLKSNGYEGASLEVFVGQNGSGNNPSDGEREEEKNLRLLKGLEKLEESVPHTAQSDGSLDGQVNLVI